MGDHQALWQWSVDDLPTFWRAVWDDLGLESGTPVGEVLADGSMPGAEWFPGVRVNYAAHMLRGNGLADDDVAVVAESQTRQPTSWTLGELRDQVRRARAGLVRLGVGEGDRVAANLPNIPEALVAFLATASLGAIWSSWSPEFGTRSVVDRWSQIEPSVLLTVDGYRYGSKAIDRAGEVDEGRAALPSIQHTVLVEYLNPDATWDGCVGWGELSADTDATLAFADVAFDHPLYVLYSSGTTGLPKPIVHGHGGILVEHVKSLGLHLDLRPGDRFFLFSTTGWMMWNYLVSGLLVGSAVVLFDGNPGHPNLDCLWELLERTGTTYMGVSAPFLMSCRKAGLTPGEDHDLSAVRAIGSTGAPLPADGFRWVYEAVGDHLQLGSVSGGTDVCAAFVGSAPVLPIHAGVILCRMLGCRVEAYNPDGSPVIGTQGKLVITAPMPSMPVGFWGDDDGPITGTLLRHVPRRVAARRLAQHPRGRRVRDHRPVRRGPQPGRGPAGHRRVLRGRRVAAGSRRLPGRPPQGRHQRHGRARPVRHPGAGSRPRRRLRGRIAAALRADLSPRHVPDTMVQMPAAPRTLSGKKLEVPVKRILPDTDPDRAASTGALVDPHALHPYVAWTRGSVA